MASGFSAHTLHIGGAAMAAVATFMQSHSADPGASGTSNVNSGPGRVACTFTDTAGVISLSSTVSFTGGTSNGAAGWISLWDASTAGNWIGNFQITTGDTTFNAAGALNVTACTITGS